MSYHLISWNVDGYSEPIHEWLSSVLLTDQPDVVFLSETKRTEAILRVHFDTFEQYNYVLNPHVPAGMHGVAMLIKKDHTFVQYPVEMNIPSRNDTKSQEASTGRVILVQLNEEINVIGAYTPNSGRYLEYRTEIWDPAFVKLLEIARASGPTLWMGDVNVALSDVDVSDPVGMSGWPGFTPIERANFAALLGTGHWLDPWRLQHPNSREYSWLGYLRKKGYGMRIDNVIVSDTLMPKVVDTYILTDGPTDSDHVPVGIVLNR